MLTDNKAKAWSLVQNNQLAEAKTLYARICQQDGRDAESWFMLGAINGQLSFFDQAESCFRRVIALHPDHVQAHESLGGALQAQGRWEEALAGYRRALQISPGNAVTHYQMGNALREQGNLEQAATCYREAAGRKPDYLEAWNNLGATLRQLGKYSESLAVLQQALGTRPDSPELLTNLGSTLVCLNRIDEGISGIRRALQIRPASAEAHHSLGNALLANKQFAEAIESYCQALRIRPEYADARASLADAYEKSAQLEKSKATAEAVIQRDPTNATANLILARLDRRADNLDAARQRIEALLQANPGRNDFGHLSVELGSIEDKCGHYGAAFAAFDAGQKALAKAGSDAERNKTAYLEGLAGKRRWYNKEKVAGWIDGLPHDKLPEPVFLVGFDRSGTTLTERILGSHAKIVTSEELPIVPRLISKKLPLLTGMQSSPEFLTKLTSADIGRLRQDYWAMAREILGEALHGKVFIDKFPLNIIELGFIHRIFPRAKVVVALRDPRDVCISCFIQAFKLNPASVFFTDLTNTARLYAAVMDLWLHYRRVLPMNYLEYRYEDLVAGLEPTTRKLLQFIGLEWEENVLHYYRTERVQYVSTPSYEGVTSPIYKGSVSRWRNYQQQMAPILDTLQPFITAFGYDEKHGR